ncbi:uncharacterized protein BDZ83DRAFT_307313 [Colletotrichum acutatum]|uniref:Uncharacterized protein n=1 Tax=Glomerella acutata TaxID=27357 RepID=A0AAD8XHZ9_GLOAC|nr:uncharacterized protein BDZ83DRAFT_307313 [Colletotrichum acutatum]KAK1725413.1 hypothetical protein BDZ83DRAFT_307313 [Colletotrichum acutatum]
MPFGNTRMAKTDSDRADRRTRTHQRTRSIPHLTFLCLGPFAQLHWNSDASFTSTLIDSPGSQHRHIASFFQNKLEATSGIRINGPTDNGQTKFVHAFHRTCLLRLRPRRLTRILGNTRLTSRTTTATQWQIATKCEVRYTVLHCMAQHKTMFYLTWNPKFALATLSSSIQSLQALRWAGTCNCSLPASQGNVSPPASSG